jgi:hypothetical protein
MAIAGAFLTAGAVVGCGGATGNVEEREGERGAAEQGADATTDEETTSPEGDRTTAEPAQKPVGFDTEVVSSVGQANLPAGFGEGTLWATGFQPVNPACDDVVRPNEGPCSASASSATSASPAGGLPKTLLKRVDSRTGEEVAAIPLKGFFTGTTEMAFGAGSVWASYGDIYPGPVSPRRPGDVVLRIDPRTNRAVTESQWTPLLAWLSGTVRFGQRALGTARCRA